MTRDTSQPGDLAWCQAQYEPGARRQQTHTCDNRGGHLLPHRCPSCGSTWNEPGGVVMPVNLTGYEHAGRGTPDGDTR